MTTTPTSPPQSARAGDTWAWYCDLPDYPAPTWTLAYTLYGAQGVSTLVAEADGARHLVSVAPAATANIEPGRYSWTATVTDGSARYPAGSGALTVLPYIARPTTAATLTTGTVGANTGLTWTAATAGSSGNAVSVTLINPGTSNASLAVTVSGSAVRASLATGSGGAITTTAATLAAAVAAYAPAAALVSVAATSGSSGAGIVSALAQTYLSGGVDAYTAYDGSSHARRMLAAIEAMLEGRATDGDLDVVKTTIGDRATDFDLPTLLKMRQQYAAAVAAEDDALRIAAGGKSRRFIQTRFI